MGLCVSAGGPFRSGVRAFGAMAAAYREYLATERGYEDAKRHLDAWSAHVRHADPEDDGEVAPHSYVNPTGGAPACAFSFQCEELKRIVELAECKDARRWEAGRLLFLMAEEFDHGEHPQCAEAGTPDTARAFECYHASALEGYMPAQEMLMTRFRYPGEEIPRGTSAATVDEPAVADGHELYYGENDPRPPLVFLHRRLWEAPLHVMEEEDDDIPGTKPLRRDPKRVF